MRPDGAELSWDHVVSRVADLLPLGILVIDPSGDARYANAAWAELTSTTPSGSPQGWLEVFPAEERLDRRDAILRDARHGTTHDADWTVPAPGGGRRTLQVRGVPDVGDGGRLAAVVLTLADVTSDRARLVALTQEAAHDELTGLYHRGRFAAFAEHALDRRRRDPTRGLGVIVVDVDDLKATNDTFGHEAGDRRLKAVADRVRAAVRSSDVVARYGGDEFAVLCDDLGDDGEAEVIAERVRSAVRSISDADGRFGASVGFALANGHQDFAELFADADQEMYLAKRQRARTSALPVTPDRPIDQLAIAAHELRSPIAAISGHVDLLRRWAGGLATDDVRRSIEVIERQAQRLERTVQDLLLLATMEHDRGRPGTACDVSSVIAEVLEIVPPPARVSLSTHVAGEPLAVVTDEPRLVRALVNLVTNAYRHGGSTVAIRARRDRGAAVIEVEDDGPGVPPELRARIFDLFAPGPSRDGLPHGSSSGLGLASARHAAESLGGRLDHTGIDPHGSRFSLRVPLTGPPPDEAALQDPAAG